MNTLDMQAAIKTYATPLPVLDICNALLTISSYLSAIQNATLPQCVQTANPTLATKCVAWQESIWQEFYEGLVDATILAQAEQIDQLIEDGVTVQSAYQAAIATPSCPVPTVISRCDDVLSQITTGVGYAAQLRLIASQLQQADQQQVEALEKTVATLNGQFDALEQSLTEKALDDGKEVVATIIDVGVAVATEENPISPLLKGISQVGFGIIDQLVLSDEIKATLAELESAWSQMDEATLQLAQVTLLLNRLDAVLSQTSQTVTALNSVVTCWETICDLINAPATQWSSASLQRLGEWAARMNRIQFAPPVSQKVSA